jgi:hypothetical protein
MLCSQNRSFSYYSLLDVDQHIPDRGLVACCGFILTLGECTMMDLVLLASAVMAAVSVGGIALTLFLIANGTITV